MRDDPNHSDPTGQEQPRRLYILIVFSLAFAAAFPIAPVQGLPLRLSDLAAVAAVLLIAIRIFVLGRAHESIIYYGIVLCASVIWFVSDFYYSAFMPAEQSARLILVRWLAAFAYAYLFTEAFEGRYRHVVCMGLMLGILASTMTVVIDSIHFAQSGKPAFETATTQLTWVGGSYRAVGIYGHPNGASIACLAGVPLLIGLANERLRALGQVRPGRVVFIATLCAVVWIGTVFYLTKSRGGTIGSSAVLIYWLARNWPRSIGMAAVAAAVLAILASVFQLVDFTSVFARFTDPAELTQNSSGRIATTLEAIGLAWEYPLGIGGAHVDILLRTTGFPTTHNAYLQIALLGGLPVTLLICVPLLIVAFRFLSMQRIETCLAFYITLVSFFESIFYSPPTPLLFLLVGWVGVRAWQHHLLRGSVTTPAASLGP